MMQSATLYGDWDVRDTHAISGEESGDAESATDVYAREIYGRELYGRAPHGGEPGAGGQSGRNVRAPHHVAALSTDTHTGALSTGSPSGPPMPPPLPAPPDHDDALSATSRADWETLRLMRVIVDENSNTPADCQRSEESTARK